MTQAITARKFEPGTTGWTVDDLADPATQWRWSQGRYELVDGVLTMMAPQGFGGIDPLSRLRRLVERHLDRTNQAGYFHNEVDLQLRRGRVARPDMLFLTPEQYGRQKQLETKKGLTGGDYCPVMVSPLLVVESLSPGHEEHDRLTKREWYAQAQIPHYWLLAAHERSLTLLLLKGDQYIVEADGREDRSLTTIAFGNLEIPLKQLWP